MEPETVVLVTRDATLDTLSEQDYWDIYHFELRRWNEVEQKYDISGERLVEMIGSKFTKALWGKWGAWHNSPDLERGPCPLNRAMRNELRTAVGQPLLPPTVAEATANASPDASVWAVGDAPAEHVIMVGTTEGITLHVNGTVTVREIGHVTTVTRPQRTRKPIVRPVATPRQNERRLALGDSWDEVIEDGLALRELMRGIYG